MDEEAWRVIPEFPNYQISDLGRVYNERTDRIMQPSINNYGHMRVSLRSEWSQERFTRSVAVLVADAFIPLRDYNCDAIMLLDGDLTNVRADNIVRRPRWMVWKYSQQLRRARRNQLPRKYYEVPIRNMVTGQEFASVVEAGMHHGLLFDDVWESVKTQKQLYPDYDMFEEI